LSQVWLKLAQWFRRRRFLNDLTSFFTFCDYLPFEDDLALYLYKLEFPLPKDNLYQVWLNLATWFWRRRFLKNFSVIVLFSLKHTSLQKLKNWISYYFVISRGITVKNRWTIINFEHDLSIPMTYLHMQYEPYTCIQTKVREQKLKKKFQKG
jgi:hypothetical protein